MEFRHINSFIAVAEELHFGRASKRLNMSQPPLSQQIRQLEVEIGVRLFNRTSRRVELTAAGLVFLAEARRIVEQTNEAVRRTNRADRGEVGHLAVGFIGSANYSVLPRVIREFRKQYQDIELSLTEMNTNSQLEALHEARIHVGFMRPPGGVEIAGISVEPVFREPLVAVMPGNHPLAEETPLPLRLLAQEPFIMIPRQKGPGFFDYIIALCQLNGFSPAIVLEASQFHTVIGLVAAGIGVSIVPASMQRSRIKGAEFRPIAEETETVLDMAWCTDNPSPVLRNFTGVARKAVRPLSPGRHRGTHAVDPEGRAVSDPGGLKM